MSFLGVSSGDQSARQKLMSRQTKRVSLPMKHIVLYNMAAFSFNIYDTALYTWLIYFYSPPLSSGRPIYLSIGVIGIILAGGRLLDILSDPIIGYFSDRTRSRWGQRKPFIFISAPFIFIPFVLVWIPPMDSPGLINAIYLVLLLGVYNWAYTGVLVPWLAVLPEMSNENEQRVKIAFIGAFVGISGAFIAGILSGIIYKHWGPLIMALLLGSIALIGHEASTLGIRENAVADNRQVSDGLLQTLKEVFGNKQMLSFALMMTFVQPASQLMLMNTPFMVTSVLQGTEADASFFVGEMMMVMALSTPVTFWLLRNFRKKTVLRALIVVMVIGFCLCFTIGTIPAIPPFIQAMIILPIASLPIGGMFIVFWSLIADLSDYDELKHGKSRKAICYGMYSIVRKISWALCPLILALTFKIFGFSAENPLGVRMIWLICSISCVIGLIAFIPYKLGDSRAETRIAINV